MPLVYYFYKTGSPSVRFYYLLTVWCCGSCISGGVVARHDIGKFTGDWWRRTIFDHTVLAHNPPRSTLDTLEFHISLPLL